MRTIAKLFSFVLAIAVLSSCSYKDDIAKLKKKVKYITSDSDKDGVANVHDKDNSTEADAKVYGNGTAFDTDGDGVADHMDEELLSPMGTQVDSLGRAADSDSDGVPDGIDMENNTPAGALVNFQGKAIAGKGQAMGSASSSSVPTEVNAGKFGDVVFTSDANIETLTYTNIIYVYNFMAANEGAKVRITGHADNTEKDDVKLGQQRADAVVAELVALGLNKDRLMTESKGKTAPANKAVSRLNRRVSFDLVR